MTISDVLIILATLLSPFLAVQSQKWIERSTHRRDAQKQVVYDLMATRATRVAPRHVQALNSIDLEFKNKAGPREREVLNRWRIYADHLNSPNVEETSEAAVTQWHAQGDTLFLDLLEALATALGYPFDRVQLRRGIDYPRAHSQAEQRKDVFEREVLRLLTGESSLNMRVTEFPVSEEDITRNRQVQEGLLAALSGDGALHTKVQPSSPGIRAATK